ncbi:hypothetical protein MMC20_006623 [Loxospora ochrophaea]|nr:hypothetical protein [Loxospora ochrophaea]
MQNILNPPAPADPTPRRAATSLESPPNAAAVPLRYQATPSPSEQSQPSSTPPPSSNFSTASSQPPRRILTPKSPTSRSLNLEAINPPNATIDAKTSPFVMPPGSVYPQAGGLSNLSDQSTRLTTPINLRPSYGFPPQPPTVSVDARPGGGMIQRQRPQTQSPATTYSSYSQQSRASPVRYDPLPTQQSPSTYPGPAYGATSGISGPTQSSIGSESSYSPVSSTMGQSTYQLMTLDTDQGPIQVPVDVQAASKMADEKRKRNAGASARFRLRRKEKEREANQAISTLQSQVREMSEERDYYRMERDYYRSLVQNTPQQVQVAARPPSPRQRKTAQAGKNGSATRPQWHSPEERAGQIGRNTRRRTSTNKSTYELPPPSILGPNQPPPGYMPASSFPYLNAESQPPSHGTPMQGPPPPRAGAYDHPPPGYERSWNNTQ